MPIKQTRVGVSTTGNLTERIQVLATDCRTAYPAMPEVKPAIILNRWALKTVENGCGKEMQFYGRIPVDACLDTGCACRQ
jgi:hypothetical protein